MRYQNSLKNKFKLLRKRPTHRLKIFFQYLFNRRDRDPVFIIATRRSGSNLLLSYLNSIQGVSFAAEILNPSMWYGLRSCFISKGAVLRHIAHSLNSCEQRLCGAKLLKINLKTHQVDPEILKKYFPRARFIILYRESLLKQFISLKIAEKTGIWVGEDPDRGQETTFIHLKREEFQVHVRKMREFYADLFEKEWLKECSVVVRYEDLADNAQKVFDEKIFPFLGLGPSPVKSSLKKQNNRPLHEIIENFNHVKDLEGTILRAG